MLGAEFQLEQLKILDPDTIQGVEVPIPGGRADAILKDGTIIDYKSWELYKEAYQNPAKLPKIQKKLIDQIADYKDFQLTQGSVAPIKIIFPSLKYMPSSLKDALEKAGAIIVEAK